MAVGSSSGKVSKRARRTYERWEIIIICQVGLQTPFGFYFNSEKHVLWAWILYFSLDLISLICSLFKNNTEGFYKLAIDFTKKMYARNRVSFKILT